MRKPIIFALAICLTMLILWGPLPAMAAEKPVELKFWHAMGGYREQILKNLVDKFNSENPGIKVEAVYVQSRDPKLGNDYHALYRSIMVNLAQKTPPDIAQVYENWTAQWIEIGALVPVGGQDEEDLIPVFRKANTYDGKLWTMPFNKSIYVLYCNMDLFEKAGVKPPATWNELRSAALKLTEREGDKVKVYGISFRPSVDMFGHFLYSHGGEFIRDNQAVFNNEAGVDDLRFWTDMVNVDRSAQASFTEREDFIEGRSAMYIDTTSGIPRFIKNLKFKVGVAELPQGSTRRYQFAGTNLAVFSHLQGARKDAAVKFVHFMTNRENTIYWALHTGYLPVRKSAVESAEYQKLLNSDSRYRVGIDALQYGEPQPKVAAWEMIRGILDDAMFDAISRRSTPEQALDRAEKMANHLIKNLTGQN